MATSRTLCALKNDFHLAEHTRKLFGLSTEETCQPAVANLGSAQWWGGGTLDAPFGPSSLEMCSRACLGKSVTVLDLALPNKKDILVGVGVRALRSAGSWCWRTG